MTTATQSSLGKALAFLERLDAEKLSYRLEHVRDSLMVIIAVPGERWEVEFFDDGHVEVERFKSPGEIDGEEALEVLFEEHAD